MKDEGAKYTRRQLRINQELIRVCNKILVSMQTAAGGRLTALEHEDLRSHSVESPGTVILEAGVSIEDVTISKDLLEAQVIRLGCSLAG